MSRTDDSRTVWDTPLWQATARNIRAREALAGSLSVDLAVIGAGFTGLSTALHAAEAGLRVAVVEAEALAHGATGRNAGFVVPNFAKMDPDAIIAKLGAARGERLIGFAAASAETVFGLIARHGIDCDARQSGWIQPAPSEAAFALLKSRAAQWQRRGRPAEVLDREALASATGARGYAGGWTDKSGGVLNPTAYAYGLADAAEAAGARVFERSPVTAVTRAGERWRLTTPGGDIDAGKVILATNAYGGGLHRDLSRSYFPLRVFQVATQPLPPSIRDRLLPGGQSVSDCRRNLFTFRFDAENRLISGGMDIVRPGADRRVPRAIHRRLARLLEIDDLPPLAYAWSGVAAVMPDFLPHLFVLGPGFLGGIACNGRGIAMTTQLGTVLADWATGTPLGALPVPGGLPAPIPFHGLMRYAPNALLPVSILKDALETR